MLRQAPRLIFLLSAGVGFLRDYLSSGELITIFIYSVFLVEGCAEVLPLPFRLRMLNRPPRKNTYLLFWVVASVVSMLAAAAALLALAIIAFQVPMVSSTIVLAAPLNVFSAYVGNFILLRGRFSEFYTVQLIKSFILFVGFITLDEGVVFSAYATVFFITFFYYVFYFKEYGLFNSAKENAAPIYRIMSKWKKDAAIQVHAIAAILAFLIDKQILALSGASVLFFLLSGKFVLFAISLNSMMLQTWQVETIEQGKSRKIAPLIWMTCRYLPIALGGYVFTFILAYPYLPISGTALFDWDVFFMVAVWLTVQMLRDAVARWFYIQDRYREVGVVITVSMLAYIAVVAAVRDFTPGAMAFLLSGVHFAALLALLLLWRLGLDKSFPRTA